MDLIALFMRWAHIVSAIVLLGGIIYARFVRSGMTDEDAARFRQFGISAIALLLISGTYNFLYKASTPSPYHAVFGVKVLLALHVIAVTLLLCKAGAPPEKRLRWLTGIAISGLVIAALSAYLRALSS